MVYVDVAVGVTVAVPVNAVLAVKPEPVEPETVTLVAVSPFHAIAVDWPDVRMPGVAVIVGEGAVTTAFTVTVAEAVTLPPDPLQVKV
jgi:hypothetical protein